MATIWGPNIVRDGLVVYLDKYNERSYLGEPTTNYFIGETWWGDGSNQGFADKGYTVVTDPALQYKELPTVLWTPGTSGNSYLHSTPDITSETSTEWAFSCYLKREDGADVTSMNVYMYFPSSDGNVAGTIESVGNGWFRVSRIRSGSAAAITLVGFTGLTSGLKWYHSGWQLEKKTHITKAIAYNTSRPEADGWKDLSGNDNHAYLTELTYTATNVPGANTNNFYLDGVNDYLRIDQIDSTTVTVAGWFKFDSTVSSGNYYVPWRQGYSPIQFGIWISDDNLIKFNVIGTSDPGLTSTGYTIGSGDTAVGKWFYLVHTVDWDANTWQLYINDSLEYSDIFSAGSYSFNNTTNNYNYTDISRNVSNNNSFIDGDIAIFQIYNRILTATEVKQNFEAHKGRYGL